MEIKTIVGRLAAAAGLALLLGSTPIVAAPMQEYGYQQQTRMSTVGTVTSMSREGDQFRIVLDNGQYAYWVPMSVVGDRDLRIGDRVRLSGLANGDAVNVDTIAFPGDRYYNGSNYNNNGYYNNGRYNNTGYTGLPYGQSGWMNGMVTNVNRHLGYVTVRDDATGRFFNVDVRHMNTRRPFDVWSLRNGDHIAVLGSWERRDRFDAQQVRFQ